MRNRRILGCLAGNVASLPRRTGSPYRFHESFVQAQQLPARRHGCCEPVRLRRSFAMSTAAHCSSVPSAQRARGVTANDGTVSLPLPEHARHILRHVADSVVVCTAHSQYTAAAPDEGSAAPVGLTMSSFAPLSLFPSPVVTFNIAVPSRTEQVISKTRHFMIHILSGDVQGARLADVFRAGNAHPANTLRALQRSGSQFVWPDTRPGLHKDHEQPFLRGAGVLYVLRCRLLDEPLRGLVPVRDHVVVLGEILEIIDGDAEAVDDAGAPRFGLLYGDRHYRQLSGAKLHTESE